MSTSYTQCDFVVYSVHRHRLWDDLLLHVEPDESFQSTGASTSSTYGSQQVISASILSVRWEGVEAWGRSRRGSYGRRLLAVHGDVSAFPSLRLQCIIAGVRTLCL